MTKWARNFISADETGNPGNCPYCRSSNVGYVIVQNPAFIEVWCNDCDKKDSISYRGTPPNGRIVMSGDEYKDWKNKRLASA